MWRFWLKSSNFRAMIQTNHNAYSYVFLHAHYHARTLWRACTPQLLRLPCVGAAHELAHRLGSARGRNLFHRTHAQARRARPWPRAARISHGHDPRHGDQHLHPRTRRRQFVLKITI